MALLDERRPDPTDLGSEELEKGMHPAPARHVAIIAGIAVALLLTFNSGALATWTQTLPSTALNLWLSERAGDWHALMLRLGPALIFERLRERVRPDSAATPQALAARSASTSTSTISGGMPKRTGMSEHPSPPETMRWRFASTTCP